MKNIFSFTTFWCISFVVFCFLAWIGSTSLTLDPIGSLIASLLSGAFAESLAQIRKNEN